MAADVTIKTGDTAPPIVGTLKDATGAVVSLIAADAVKFIMRDKATGTKIIDADCTIPNAAGGVVQYQWIAGDTDIIDTYNAEFEVAWSDGTYETFPNSKYIVVRIITDLGGTVR